MSWIETLDEHGYNVLIDELAWHLREGRQPSGVVRRSAPEPGVEFQFPDRDGAFLFVDGAILDMNWREAAEVVRQFPQLHSFEFREV
jgi:hypothetical protein